MLRSLVVLRLPEMSIFEAFETRFPTLYPFEEMSEAGSTLSILHPVADPVEGGVVFPVPPDELLFPLPVLPLSNLVNLMKRLLHSLRTAIAAFAEHRVGQRSVRGFTSSRIASLI